MPIRTASINPQIRKNGAVLHLVRSARVAAQGTDAPPSEVEQVLLQEREALKTEKARRAGLAPVRKAKVAKTTHHAMKSAKAKEKAPKADKAKPAAKDGKAAKAKPTRAEKLVKKAEAVEAAKKSARKPAKA